MTGSATQPTVRATSPPGRDQGALSGVLLGVGTAAFVDETVFHQLLHWHHFYDRSTPTAGLVSDGLFHAVGWFATVAALFLLVRVRRLGRLRWPTWTAGLLLGLGGFQLYDGTVQHKLLGLHQVRYDVDLLPYDLGWNLFALLAIAAGVLVGLRGRRARIRG